VPRRARLQPRASCARQSQRFDSWSRKGQRTEEVPYSAVHRTGCYAGGRAGERRGEGTCSRAAARELPCMIAAERFTWTTPRGSASKRDTRQGRRCPRRPATRRGRRRTGRDDASRIISTSWNSPIRGEVRKPALWRNDRRGSNRDRPDCAGPRPPFSRHSGGGAGTSRRPARNARSIRTAPGAWPGSVPHGGGPFRRVGRARPKGSAGRSACSA